MELNIKNNKAKITAIYIHGYNSSGDSSREILNKNINFNFVYFNYPTDKIYNVQEMALEVDKIVNKIKGAVVIIGHSLGGAIMSHMKDRFKIKKYIYLSALSPILAENKGVKFLSKNPKGKSAIKNILAKSLSIFGKENLSVFVNPPKQWSRFSSENIMNIEYLTNVLNKQYELKSNKSIAIIGTKDIIFNHKKYNEYMSNHNIECYEIEEAGHGIILDASSEVAKILNKNIKFKRRWIGKIEKNKKFNSSVNVK